MSTVIDQYMALSPREFPNLERALLLETGGDYGLEVELELTFRGAGGERLVVRCAGVRELSFRQPFTSGMKLHLLEVRDVSGAQLESISFEVRDIEQQWLSFSCRTFEAERRSL